MPIRCGDCGHTLDLPPERPCSHCGSLKRNQVIEIGGQALSISGGHAEKLIPENAGIATVVAHMACEVVTERALSRAFASRGVPDLEEPVLGFWNGYNLATPRNRNLYVALTGDKIHEQAFWPAFSESAKLRNQIIHAGQAATTAEAERSLTAAQGFVAHVTHVCT
jgi:hypothetical protein